MGPPWGGVGQFVLADNEFHIYPNMCAKFGCGLTVVSKKGGTDRQTMGRCSFIKKPMVDEHIIGKLLC